MADEATPLEYPEDYAAFEAARNKPAAEPDKSAPEAPAPAALTGDTAKDAPSSETVEGQERDENGRFKAKEEPAKAEEPEAELPPGVQKRIQKEIDKAVKARREAERYAEELRVKATQGADPVKNPEPDLSTKPTAPRISQFEDLEAYEVARDKYQEDLIAFTLAREKLAEEQVKQQEKQRAEAQTFTERIEAAKKVHADFEDVAFDSSIPYSPAMIRVVQSLNEGADVAYFLGKNPAEAERISKLPEFTAAVEIGKIVAKLAPHAPDKPKPSVTPAKLPKPPQTVEGGAVSIPDVFNETFGSDFGRWEQERIRQLRSRLR